jgi:hypothetical protein
MVEVHRLCGCYARNTVNKNLPAAGYPSGELRGSMQAHTFASASLLQQAAPAENSFIVAKPSEPSRFSCNPGALLLLPPSLVRAGALRSIFIFRPLPGQRASCARLKFTANGLMDFHRDGQEASEASQLLLF